MLLLKQLDNALAPIEPCLRCRVEIRAELCKCGQLAELSEIELHLASDLFDRFDLSGGTDTTDRESDRDRWPNALIKQIRLEVNLSVCDGNDVGRNIGGHVACLRLNDRKRRERTTAKFFPDARTSFEQSRVQIKHIAWVSFAARRPFQHQGNLTIRDCVFR